MGHSVNNSLFLCDYKIIYTLIVSEKYKANSVSAEGRNNRFQISSVGSGHFNTK